jgi:farnesyl-diphosphate farnesyltransferase
MSAPALPLDLLRDVSRSFYLTLRVLPARIRPQIGLAYLLARTTDTIADTELVVLERRTEALGLLRDRILGASEAPLNFGEFVQHQGAPAERTLLQQCESSLAALRSFTPPDLKLLQEVLDKITSGQELDLRRFAGASAKHVIALRTDDELNDYTYRVAGCVGEFWTRMCRSHLFPNAPLDDSALLADGIRFGKGLQLVNILRDLPRDLRQGRCYLPAEKLRAAALEPEDLLDPANELRLRPLYAGYLDQAEAHLRAGWTYTNSLPRGSVRVRLACAWPIQVGFETLKLLRVHNVLDSAQRIKIPRRRVKRLILGSILRYPWPRAWQRLVPILPE